MYLDDHLAGERRWTAFRPWSALWLLCLSLTISSAAAARRPKVDVFGYYSLAGRVPPALGGIDHLHLSTIRIRHGKVVNVPLWGFIRLKARGRAKAVDLR